MIWFTQNGEATGAGLPPRPTNGAAGTPHLPKEFEKSIIFSHGALTSLRQPRLAIHRLAD
jgi:hypothetical protein